MHARAAVLTVLALALPAFAALAPAGAEAPLAFPCDTPMAGMPCNLRMTFAPHAGNENYLAVNPANPLNIVATSKDYGLSGNPGVLACSALNVWTGYYASQDGGQTWTNGYAAGYAGGPSSPISGYRCSTDPVVGFDNAGTAYLSGLAYNSEFSTDALWVAKSTDGGVTFQQLTKADESNFNDKNWMAVDPDTGNVYVTWTCFCSDQGIYVRRSLGGDITSWEPRIKLSGGSSFGAQASYPVVGPDGTVHVLWNDNIQGGSGNMWYAKSTDQAATFTAERSLFTYNAGSWSGDAEYRTPTIPQLAVDRSTGPHRGDLYIVYQGQAADGHPDIFFRRSTDGGNTWGPEVRLNDDPVGNGKGQNFPAITVDPSNGWLHVSFYDRRDDANNRLFNTYYTVSKDGGLNWSKNQRISTHSSDPTPCKHQSGATFIGDYTGIGAAGGKARPSFVDTRNGRCDLYTALAFAGPRLLGSAARYADAGQPLTVGVTASAYTPLDTAVLEVDLPSAWAIDDADGGVVVPGPGVNTVRWTLGALGGDVARHVTATPAAPAIVDLKSRLDWTLSADGTASGREAWNSTVYVSYPELWLDLGAPRNAYSLSAFNVTVRIDNWGTGAATDAALDLTVPAGVVPVPRGAGVDPAGPSAGLQFGVPLSDPTAVGPTALRWTLPTIPAGSHDTYRLVFLAPAAVPGQVSNYDFVAAVHGLAPDGAALAAQETERTRLGSVNQNAALATPGILADYLTG